MAGALEGAVFHAHAQTGGHGRHGRAWVSPPGNLYLSFVLTPQILLTNIGHLSLLTGLALAQVLKAYLSDHSILKLKWPNDVLLDGEKCAGILIENIDGQGMIFGVGCNLASAPEGKARLHDFCDKAPDVKAMRDQFLEQFEKLYTLWQRQGFESIKSLWLGRAHAAGEPVQVKVGTRVIEGAFEALDTHGNMILRDAQGQRITITGGDVFLSDEKESLHAARS